MIDLAGAQRAIYEAIRGAADAPCFVRLCMDHGALWVSDLPRRTDRLAPALSALVALGIRCDTDPTTGLWRLDWTAMYAVAAALSLGWLFYAGRQRRKLRNQPEGR